MECCLKKAEGDLVREYKATHEENVLSRWPREDVEGMEERRKDMDNKAREEESRSGKREVEREKEENGCCEKKVCESVFQ